MQMTRRCLSTPLRPPNCTGHTTNIANGQYNSAFGGPNPPPGTIPISCQFIINDLAPPQVGQWWILWCATDLAFGLLVRPFPYSRKHRGAFFWRAPLV